MRLNGTMATEVAKEAFLPALKYGEESPTRCEREREKVTSGAEHHRQTTAGDLGLPHAPLRRNLSQTWPRGHSGTH